MAINDIDIFARGAEFSFSVPSAEQHITNTDVEATVLYKAAEREARLYYEDDIPFLPPPPLPPLLTLMQGPRRDVPRADYNIEYIG